MSASLHNLSISSSQFCTLELWLSVSFWGIHYHSSHILQIVTLHQAVDWHSISPEKVQWLVMQVPAVVYLMGDLIQALPHQAQAQALAQMMCQLMM